MSNTTEQGTPVTQETSSPAQPTSSPAETPASSHTPQSSEARPTSNTPPPASPTSSPAQPTSQSPSPASQSTPAQTPTSASPPPTQPQPTPTQPAPTTNAPATSNQPPPATTPANDPTTVEPLTTVVVVTPSDGGSQTTVVLVISTTQGGSGNTRASTVSSSASSTATPIGTSGGSGSGLSQGGKVAIGVVVPIAAIALLALVGLFWWKKRRARQQAEEERRKEVEDYSYNPNADPTIPNVIGGDSAYEMREDGAAGYRGWGTTTVAGSSTGRKASTTMSGGVNGPAYSDATSPTTRGNMSDTPLMELDGSHSPEGEILGAMGPSSANNRGADVHRGPSNASSSYSAAARSDNSDGIGMTYGAGGSYYDQYAQNNPYSDNALGQQNPPGQPIIRDNPARRNTRIENPSHYPQQSAGISQNF